MRGRLPYLLFTLDCLLFLENVMKLLVLAGVHHLRCNLQTSPHSAVQRDEHLKSLKDVLVA